ncbi:superoxide dismutase [Nocardioides rubriscoriae]|uniref:superoxide dismutase n=1 Tax=Nocardioides rubriscoriae TaxID=642762 RepID=UPI0011DF150E|nr:superoxide dismutase [Nocardioides rubriscoriae]
MNLGNLRTRSALTLLAAAATTAALVSPVASPATAADQAAKPTPPASVALPDGFQPEGIAIAGRFGYFGSRVDGDIYRADLTTGQGKRISQGPGTPALGLKVGPQQRLYVSGGDSGTVRIVSMRSGKTLRTLRVSRTASFVNDVVLTKRAAWFTDSLAPKVYRVPINRDGSLPRKRDVRVLRLRGDWTQPTGGDLGANGITVAPSGPGLLVVDSSDGTLFRVSRTGRSAGRARLVDLGGASLTNGDGMLLEGRRLYVVRNQLNEVVVLRLDAAGETGRQVRSFTSPRFDVPTTVDRSDDGALYLPNARFSTPPTPETTYDVTRVERG